MVFPFFFNSFFFFFFFFRLAGTFIGPGMVTSGIRVVRYWCISDFGHQAFSIGSRTEFFFSNYSIHSLNLTTDQLPTHYDGN